MCATTANSLIELMNQFPDDESCRKHLEEKRWNGKPVCPHCKHEKVYTFKDCKTYKCANTQCQKKFNVKTGTIYENSNISLRKWFIGMYLITSHKKGISSCQLAKDVKITQKSAWFMLHKCREMMNENHTELSGSVEMDETYYGGEEKNKHEWKKTEGTQGRSTKTKKPIFGMLERDGNLIAQVVDDTKRATLEPIITQTVEAKSIVYTDEHTAYNHLHKRYDHTSVTHSAKEFVNGMAHTNGLEGFWSLFKRGIDGIYHSVSWKHLQKYVNEYAFRYNTRRMKEGERLERAIANCGTRIRYIDLIGKSKIVQNG